jgi:hypothetical protein
LLYAMWRRLVWKKSTTLPKEHVALIFKKNYVEDGTWLVTSEIRRKIQTFVTRCLRYILRIWWPNIISNKDLRKATGQEDINLEIKRYPVTGPKAQRGGGVEGLLYSFLTSALEGVGWSAPRPGRFKPGNDPLPLW